MAPANLSSPSSADTQAPLLAQRGAMADAVVRAHPELAHDPNKLAFVVRGLELQAQHPQANATPVAPADATAVPTPGRQGQSPELQLVHGVATATAQLVGDGANAIKLLFTGSQNGQDPRAFLNRGGAQPAPSQNVANAPQLTPEQTASVQRGTALLATLAAGPLAEEALPALAPSAGLLARGFHLAAASTLGGLPYSLIRPLAPDESRPEAVFNDAKVFGPAGFVGGLLTRQAASLSAAQTSAEVAARVAQTGTLDAASRAGVLDAATDVAASRIHPTELASPALKEDAATPFHAPLDNALARLPAPYADAPVQHVPTEVQLAARAMPNVLRAGSAAPRVLTGMVGGALRFTPQGADEPDWLKASRNYVGGLLMLGSIASSKNLQEWAAGGHGIGPGIAKRVMTTLDVTNAMRTPGAAESFAQLRALFTAHEDYVAQLEQRLGKNFATPEARRALAYAPGPEGQVAGNPWMTALTPAQQADVAFVRQMHAGMGETLEQRGLVDAAKENYMPHLLPDELQAKLRSLGSQRVAGLSTTPGFTKSSSFGSLSELQDYLRAHSLPLASEDGVANVAAHARAYFRTLRNDAVLSSLKEQGLLQTLEPSLKNATRLMPGAELDGWRRVALPQTPNMIAPTDVADALEALENRSKAPSAGMAAYDALQSAAMRTIMFNPVIHGTNMLRAGLAAGISPQAYLRWARELETNASTIEHFAGYGLITAGRATEGLATRDAFDRLFQAAGQPGLTHSAMFERLGALSDWNEEALFGRQGFVNKVRVATMGMERAKWMARNPGALPGSAAYDAAMTRIASYANDVSGGVNGVLRTDGAKQFLQRTFFAPQWFETRWRLTLGALNDVRQVATGAMRPADALYLQYKARSLALAAAATWALSRLWSGRDPEYNPNTARFYAHTGLTDAKGREMGFDPAGFWDEDIRAINSPGTYLSGKLSFALKALPTAAFGQDATSGRPLSAGENIEQFLGSFGGLAEAAETGARALAQGRPPSAREFLRMAPAVAGLGNTATLPSPRDLTLAKVAARVLAKVELPTDNERVWQLSSLMRAASEKGEPMLGGAAHAWLVQQKGALAGHSPGTALALKGWATLQRLFSPQPE